MAKGKAKAAKEPTAKEQAAAILDSLQASASSNGRTVYVISAVQLEELRALFD